MNAVETIKRQAGGTLRPAEHAQRHGVGQQRWLRLSLLVDGLMLAAAAALERASVLTDAGRTVPFGWLLALPLVTLAVLAARGAYRSRLRLDLVDDLRLIVVTTTVVAMAFLTARVLLIVRAIPAAMSAGMNQIPCIQVFGYNSRCAYR